MPLIKKLMQFENNKSTNKYELILLDNVQERGDKALKINN